jgi:catechol 2,3-dioxygenase-like lactoylglutathione lyase family enzyme
MTDGSTSLANERRKSVELAVQHIEVHVTSVEKVRDFYVDKLGLQVLDDMPELNLLAVRAGQIRVSIFGGYEPKSDEDKRKCGSHLIFRTDNLERTIEVLSYRGVTFNNEIVEAGGFIRDIATTDPDGNVVEFAEYLRDPLARHKT